jgi:hypothetical protein
LVQLERAATALTLTRRATINHAESWSGAAAHCVACPRQPRATSARSGRRWWCQSHLEVVAGIRRSRAKNGNPVQGVASLYCTTFHIALINSFCTHALRFRLPQSRLHTSVRADLSRCPTLIDYTNRLQSCCMRRVCVRGLIWTTNSGECNIHCGHVTASFNADSARPSLSHALSSRSSWLQSIRPTLWCAGTPSGIAVGIGTRRHCGALQAMVTDRPWLFR